MANALTVVAIVLCMSSLEAMWTWLLAAAISEVAGQRHPSMLGMGLVLFGGWFGARILAMAHLPVGQRRWILAGVGLAAAAAAGTVQAGLMVPIQLVVGHHSAELRGAGLTLFLLVAYLWARGLALAAAVSRERVLNHIAVSAGGLGCVLLFLPLVEAVQQLGLSLVVASFLMAVGALLLVQLAGTQSYQLTRPQWASVGAATAMLLLLGGAALTGAFSSGALGAIARGLEEVGQKATPLTDAILLGLGYLAHQLAFLFRWLGQIFGGDPEAMTRAMQAAEEARTQFEDLETPAPPLILAALVTAVLTTGVLALIVWLFHRLVHPAYGQADDVQELRTSLPPGAGGLISALRGALDRLSGRERQGQAVDGLDARLAIRRHYRAFQILMARAGLPRSASETPLEYQGALGTALPAAQLPIAEITDAYVVARYAEPDGPVPDPEGVRRAVLRVREALRAQTP